MYLLSSTAAASSFVLVVASSAMVFETVEVLVMAVPSPFFSGVRSLPGVDGLVPTMVDWSSAGRRPSSDFSLGDGERVGEDDMTTRRLGVVEGEREGSRRVPQDDSPSLI
jgi:hypothetical protein